MLTLGKHLNPSELSFPYLSDRIVILREKGVKHFFYFIDVLF